MNTNCSEKEAPQSFPKLGTTVGNDLCLKVLTNHTCHIKKEKNTWPEYKKAATAGEVEDKKKEVVLRGRGCCKESSKG